MIVIHHTHGYFGYGSRLASALPLDQGVSFFFVLSGFILFYNNGDIRRLDQAKLFICSRVARIWPLHMATLCITIMFLPQPWGPSGPALGPALMNALLLQAWVPMPGYFFSFNAVSWSLSSELFFYLLFPALVFGWRRSWTWKLALCASFAGAAIWLAARWQLGVYDGSETLSIDSVVYINPVARVFEFCLGMVAAHGWLYVRQRWQTVDPFVATVLEALAFGLVLASMTTLLHIYDAAFSQGRISAGMLKWLASAGTAPLFALLIAVYAEHRGALSRLLGWAPFVLLGEISFSLYMVHQILFRSLTSSGTLSAFGTLRMQYCAYWLLALGSSYGLFRLVEQPCRRSMLNTLLPRSKTGSN